MLSYSRLKADSLKAQYVNVKYEEEKTRALVLDPLKNIPDEEEGKRYILKYPI